MSFEWVGRDEDMRSPEEIRAAAEAARKAKENRNESR
jgi:hypothetical protein